MGGKGNNGLSAEIIVRKERGNHGRGFVPPNGVTHKDRVVLGDIIYGYRNFRMRAILNFCFRFLLQIAIFFCPLNLR